MEVGETELLQELFSFPLVSHVEVEEKGILYLVRKLSGKH